MKIDKQIKKLFTMSSIPVYVPGRDIEIKKSEIIYTASISNVVTEENPAWDLDSVSKPKTVLKVKTKTLKFVIRKGIVMVIGFSND